MAVGQLAVGAVMADLAMVFATVMECLAASDSSGLDLGNDFGRRCVVNLTGFRGRAHYGADLVVAGYLG